VAIWTALDKKRLNLSRTVPHKKTREGTETGKIDAGGGVAADNFAPQKGTANPEEKRFQPDSGGFCWIAKIPYSRCLRGRAMPQAASFGG
jgi:hypothetical protein